MGGRWRRAPVALAVLVVVVVVAVGAAGCRDDGSDGADPTVPRRTTTSDPFAVPDPIDAAYVERVMEALDHIYGDAAREVAREKALTFTFNQLMHSIYADEETFGQTMELWERERDRGFANLASDPGDPRTTVTELIATRADCVIAEVERDFSPVSPTVEPRAGQYVVLVRGSAFATANPTGWTLRLDGFLADGSAPTEAECDV